MLHGAEIVERLHERERDAGGDGRPRQGQRHLAEAAPGRAAEGPADLERADRLLEEGRAGEKVDVRVEHEGEDRGDSADRADLREPVVAAAPAERGAQGALDRARKIEKARIGVRDDVGRDRERQQKRRLEERAPRKAAHRDEPGGADAYDPGADRDPAISHSELAT